MTPHLGVRVLDEDGRGAERNFRIEKKERIVSEETSDTMREHPGEVVSEGSGKNAAIWRAITSAERRPRPRRSPEAPTNIFLLSSALRRQTTRRSWAWCVIYDPQGVYYGGTIAAPVMRDIFENILPYLGIEKE